MSCLAIFVIVGTILESLTESHLFAANLTYHHPLFLLLLGGFFLNILLSALRRWPFQAKHLPFLITHLGLLMIIGGVFFKIIFGVQGRITLIEGTGKHKVMIPDSFSLSVKKRGDLLEHSYPLKKGKILNESSPFKDLKIEPLYFTENCHQEFHTWIKDHHVSILGEAPIPLREGSELLSLESKVLGKDGEEWEILAFKEDDLHSLFKRLFLDDLSCRFIDTLTKETIALFPFKECLKGYPFSKGEVQGHFHLDPPSLHFNFNDAEISIPLSGLEALTNYQKDGFGTYPVQVTLERNPRIVFCQTSSNHDFLFAFSPQGEVYKETLSSDLPDYLYIYESGFLGYTVPLRVPFSHSFYQKKFERKIELLKTNLRSLPPSELPYPLQKLHRSCQEIGGDFAENLTQFLLSWDKQNSWLYDDDERTPQNLSQLIKNISWIEHDKMKCLWGARLISLLENELRTITLKELIQKWPWSLFSQGMNQNFPQKKDLFSAVTKGVLLLEEEFPLKKQLEHTPESLFSYYLRAYDLHLQDLLPTLPPEEEKIVLETPLTYQCIAKAPLTKLEENVPSLTLKISDSISSEILTLPLSHDGSGLKWGALEGRFLIQYLPEQKTIPYHLRLRQARKIPYSHSDQAKGYECDLLIRDIKSGKYEDATLSMNHVHETRDGYRFYLEGIHEPSPMSPKRVQIIVNRDPAKYFLTYPGGMLTCLGILLLFWIRPYGGKRE